MSYDMLQWAIIAFAVAASLVHALQRLAPGLMRRLRTRLALACLRLEQGTMLRRFGRWLAPRPVLSASPGCAAGSCNGCDSDGGPAHRSR